MTIKSNKELSFGTMLDNGVHKEEIMRHFGIDETKFNKLKAEVERIRKGVKG